MGGLLALTELFRWGYPVGAYRAFSRSQCDCDRQRARRGRSQYGCDRAHASPAGVFSFPTWCKLRANKFLYNAIDQGILAKDVFGPYLATSGSEPNFDPSKYSGDVEYHDIVHLTYLNTQTWALLNIQVPTAAYVRSRSTGMSSTMATTFGCLGTSGHLFDHSQEMITPLQTIIAGKRRWMPCNLYRISPRYSAGHVKSESPVTQPTCRRLSMDRNSIGMECSRASHLFTIR
ncbi:uncharacterized protein C8Q71DRAFT_850512 [Rhodofomes roseus]|uniref:Uncharacterized protein n=1 Tax=Rhodofomes roseus TaxID=34475 RepID=A0ABQ8K4W3_9APHY|nr:uncharacterized protein C8Q71DRAFT_850512 [Rhodofomes roseus]KAH9832001.1 hypothetical protein C8Q71DRAFT_850512 [Rhodofomes roseus]